MAVPANTVQTFAMVGIREQLSDVITMTDPTEVPFYSAIRKGSAKNRTPEWQIDTLTAPAPTNAVVEGDVATNSATTQPTRIKNVVQLMDKVVEASSTSQVVEAAGRANELNYQVVKKGKELKRDIEARITGNYASVLGNASTAGQCAGAEAYLTSNTDRGVSGANGGFNSGTGLIAAATDGTLRTSTGSSGETILKSVIAKAYANGGKPETIMVNALLKQRWSGLPGIATSTIMLDKSAAKSGTVITGAADVYKSDFGLHSIVPNRFMGYGTGRTNTGPLAADNNRTALALDIPSWKLDFLQPMKTVPLAKTGHSDRRMLFCEFTLECQDERKNGIAADLQ